MNYWGLSPFIITRLRVCQSGTEKVCNLQAHKGVNAVEGISDLKIIGIDEKRPPIIRKEPYIDIFFKLSHQAPTDWCNDFNALLSKHPTSPRIKEKEGLYIESWVKTPDEIVAFLTLLKGKVADCNQQYIERIELSARNAAGAANDALAQESGEQGRLNKILGTLDFSDVKIQ
jgi:hypothetical protein